MPGPTALSDAVPTDAWSVLGYAAQLAVPTLALAGYYTHGTARLAYAFALVAITGVGAVIWRRRTTRQRPPLSSEIRTDRFALRVATVRDAPAYQRLLDDEFRHANGWTPAIAADAVAALAKRPLPGLYLVCLNDNTVAGFISLDDPDPARRAISLGWAVDKVHRRKHLATDAVRVMVDHLHDAGFEDVRIGTATTNTAVRRTAGSIDANYVDSWPHQLPDGSVVDSAWYLHRRDGGVPPASLGSWPGSPPTHRETPPKVSSPPALRNSILVMFVAIFGPIVVLLGVLTARDPTFPGVSVFVMSLAFLTLAPLQARRLDRSDGSS